MSAYVDTDEGRFQIHVHTDDGQHVTVDIHAEALEFYENVRDEMSEWYAEAMSAKRAVRAGVREMEAVAAGYRMLSRALGYDVNDPKHPAFHDNVSRIHDERQ